MKLKKDGHNIDENGNRSWYKNGELHHEDGPAYIELGGVRQWYQYGLKHRLDGPAVIHGEDSSEYWIHGIFYGTKKSFKRARKIFKNEAFYYIDPSGNDQWIMDGIVTTIEDKEYWIKDGKLHRDDGPAIITSYNHKVWIQNGKLHRLDGPAIEWWDGNESFYIEGKEIAKKKFKKKLKIK